jgi:hypothetical protein
MPASPWRTFGTLDPNYDFVVLLSFLPLKSYWSVLPFFFYTAQVVWQLASDARLTTKLFFDVSRKPLCRVHAWKTIEYQHHFLNAHHCTRRAVLH